MNLQGTGLTVADTSEWYSFGHKATSWIHIVQVYNFTSTPMVIYKGQYSVTKETVTVAVAMKIKPMAVVYCSR